MNTLSMDPELGQEVAVEGIHTALRQLWAQDEARTNACLINFAVYSEQPGSLRKNSEIVRVLTREHACRALLIEMDRGATQASIRAWITAHCHLSEGRKSVCCEQISFALTGVSRGRLRNTVFAHLSSDLPLILWWQGELSPIFEERLYSVIDRFVFDSADWENPSESFRLVDQAISESSHPLVIQDLAWTRSYHFRLAVASLFDDPLAQQQIGAIRLVEITCHPRHRNSALQLLAWLAVLGGWRTGLELHLAISKKHGNKQGFSFEQKNGAVIEATLTFDENSAPVGLLHIAGGSLDIKVDREKASTHIHMRLAMGDHVTDTLAPAGCDDCALLIGEQLARGGKNSLFLKILPMFREMLD
jgi:glucose-6-phosphate dehydrogenase assembly protein OpcA